MVEARKDRIGEKNINNQGLKMWIKEYKNSRDINVEFEDGFIAYKKQYLAFKKGQINNNNFEKLTSNPVKKERLGEINYNFNGEKMVIIKYNNKRNIIVEFDNGYKIKTRYDIFKSGHIKNPLIPNVFGIGYIGVGKYKSGYNGKDTKQYQCWSSMINRCYSKEYHERFPTYLNCTVCDEWHNFQNFANWFDDNYYEIGNEKMCLDKDILHKGNKIYSPETCVFVSNDINILFVKNNAKRGDFPIGVYFDKSKNKYTSQCSMKGKYDRKLGTFNNPIDAFNTYKSFKEKHIKEVANDYKDKIPERLYIAMMNYIVEITD